MVFAHVFQFCRQCQRGLGMYTEQTFVSMHAKWKEHARYCLRNDMNDPEYGKSLLKATKDFNVLHLGRALFGIRIPVQSELMKFEI